MLRKLLFGPMSAYIVMLLIGLALSVRALYASCPVGCAQSQVSCASIGSNCPGCAIGCGTITLCCNITSFSHDYPVCGTCRFGYACGNACGQWYTISWKGKCNGSDCSGQNHFCCNPCNCA